MLQQFYPQPKSHNFKYELHKDMNFASAHFISHESAGKCQNVHGHTYFCDITVAGDELDEAGFLVNFQILKKLVHDSFDHQLLNQFKEFGGIPTTELVAEYIWQTIEAYLSGMPNKPHCLQVVLRETPTSYVIFRPSEVQQ